MTQISESPLGYKDLEELVILRHIYRNIRLNSASGLLFIYLKKSPTLPLPKISNVEVPWESLKGRKLTLVFELQSSDQLVY